MNLGFACVESGFCRAKNTVTIMAKNFVVFAVASVAFLLLGFGIMFGDGNALFGTQGLWFVNGADQQPGHRRRLPGRVLGDQLDRRRRWQPA
jgi:Amt family ammonium transporter